MKGTGGQDASFQITDPAQSTRTRCDPLPDNAPHILVVDDDQKIRDLLSRFLLSSGFRVTQAADAASARSYMRGLSFDLVLLDVMMPGETGLSLARDLKATRPVPILMLTALANPEDRIAGLETGVDDYMPASADHSGKITVREVMRGGKEHVEKINVPNWSSTADTVSVFFRDYVAKKYKAPKKGSGK